MTLYYIKRQPSDNVLWISVNVGCDKKHELNATGLGGCEPDNLREAVMDMER